MSDKENHYEGLMASMRHARNRLLFFLIFAAYNFLAILGTTDSMLFLESGVTMPFLNIQLPLLAFYAVMPLFLLILYFHLLYTFRSYRRFLLDSQAERDDALKYLPIGLYEGALLHQDGFHRGVRFAMRLLLYFLPLLVFAAFWFRFADYQSPVLSLWHLILLVIASLLGLHFRGLLKQIEPQRSRIFKSIFRCHNDQLLESIPNTSLSQLNSGADIYAALRQLIHLIKKYAELLAINLALLFFLGSIFSYHFNVIYPLSIKNIDLSELDKLKEIEGDIDRNWESFLNRDQWFLPRIIIQGEVLVELNKDQLEILQNLENAYLKKQVPKNTTLLLAAPPQNQSQRNFRLITLKNCTLTRINFNHAQLQGADLNFAQLQGASLSSTQLQGASLSSTQLQGASLISAQLQGTDLSEVQLQGASLWGAQLQGADLRKAQLQGVHTSGSYILFNKTKLQAANINKINRTILSKQQSEQIIALIRSHTNIEDKWDKKRLDHSIKHLQDAIGKDPIAWVKNQPDINLGILTEQEFNKISNSITEPKARKNMGLAP